MKSSKGNKEYGRQFSFNQYMLQKSFFSMISLIFMIFAISLIAKAKPIRERLKRFIPSGTGPSSEKRKKHWFEVTVVGSDVEKEVVTTIKGGDPGYEETSKFISEMALCILTDTDKLKKQKGILTAIECAGSLITKRLSRAGITIDSKQIPLDEKS